MASPTHSRPPALGGAGPFTAVLPEVAGSSKVLTSGRRQN
jgi:hypothetical protein